MARARLGKHDRRVFIFRIGFGVAMKHANVTMAAQGKDKRDEATHLRRYCVVAAEFENVEVNNSRT
jgi:hypothetical protein